MVMRARRERGVVVKVRRRRGRRVGWVVVGRREVRKDIFFWGWGWEVDLDVEWRCLWICDGLVGRDGEGG